jgi:hypothetical protein
MKKLSLLIEYALCSRPVSSLAQEPWTPIQLSSLMSRPGAERRILRGRACGSIDLWQKSGQWGVDVWYVNQTRRT